MKKILTLSVFCFLFSQFILAGSVLTTGKTKTIKNKIISPRSSKSALRISSVPVWSDDFSVPANWTFSTEGGTTDNWVISTTGPSGSYPIDTIASASAANGYALFDSDLLCSGNQIADITTTNSINLSGVTNVALRFSQYYRRYFDSTFVFVSNDHTTWTKFPINETLIQNAYSSNNNSINPAYVSLDISSVASNQSTVWIRFQFYSPSTLNANAGCGYAWMIDDVSIQDFFYASGNVFHDMDMNGVRNGAEIGLANKELLMLPDSEYTFTDGNGDYSFMVYSGTHTISWVNPNSHFVQSSSPATYTFTISSNISGNDFGIYSTNPDYSSTIDLTAVFARCHYSTPYIVTYTNLGNAVEQGTVYIVKDSAQQFDYSIPAWDLQNGDTVFWYFNNLQPLMTNTIELHLIQPVGNNTSVLVRSNLEVLDAGGIFQANYTSESHLPILCSLDPNDKTAIPVGVDDIQHYTLYTDTMDYIIRFQNTGNDTAFLVRISDTLDASLDISSLEIIASSSPVQLSIDQNRCAVFTFNNILLPDSIVDEPHSHGFVRYRIRTLANVSLPHRLENTAYIYFDFNPAVVTNTTWNTLVQSIPLTVTQVVQPGSPVFYPNPATTEGLLTFENPGSVHFKIVIYDSKGTLVRETNTYADRYIIRREKLSGGLYFYKLSNLKNGQTWTGKIIFR